MNKDFYSTKDLVTIGYLEPVKSGLRIFQFYIEAMQRCREMVMLEKKIHS